MFDALFDRLDPLALDRAGDRAVHATTREGLRRLVDGLESRVDARRRLSARRLFERRARLLDADPLTGLQEVGVHFERLARRCQNAVSLDAVLCKPSAFEILFAVIERVEEHSFDGGVVEPVAR